MKGTETLPRAAEAEKEYLGRFFKKPSDAGELLALGVADNDLECDPFHQQILGALRRQHLNGGINIELLREQLKPPTSTHDLSRDYFDELAGFAGTFAATEYAASAIIEAGKKRARYDHHHTLANHAINGWTSDQLDRANEAASSKWKRESEAGRSTYKFSFEDLERQYPRLHSVVIDNIGREGEVANIISTSKAGKSWLAAYILLCIITGRDLFGRFATSMGHCLLIDNELHRPTIVSRVNTVANAMGIPADEWKPGLQVWALRGQLRSFADIANELDSIDRGTFKAIVYDAKYRFANQGDDENDNAAQALFYNRADQTGESTGALQLFVHHTSKGSQSDKRVTDVGAGAGAQSRAPDCHLVLREHEERGVVVLDAAVRSFPPIEPLPLRWVFPLWQPADDIDPAKLKGRQGKQEERQNQKDQEGIDSTLTALSAGPATARQLRRITGFGEYRQQRLVDLLISRGDVTPIKVKVGKSTHEEYQLNQ